MELSARIPTTNFMLITFAPGRDQHTFVGGPAEHSIKDAPELAVLLRKYREISNGPTKINCITTEDRPLITATPGSLSDILTTFGIVQSVDSLHIIMNAWGFKKVTPRKKHVYLDALRPIFSPESPFTTLSLWERLSKVSTNLKGMSRSRYINLMITLDQRYAARRMLNLSEEPLPLGIDTTGRPLEQQFSSVREDNELGILPVIETSDTYQNEEPNEDTEDDDNE